MASDAFLSVRAALGAIDNGTITDPNTSGTFNLSTAGDIGGVEVEKLIDRMIVDGFSRDTEFRQLVRRERLPPGTIVASWIIKTATGSKADFYAEGEAGTPAISTKQQATQLVKALRSDYEVSGLLIAGGFFDVLADEARDAVTDMNIKEEKQMVNGTDANAGGDADGYPGLLQLMLENSAHGDTSTLYGLVRGTATIDVQAVDGGTSGTSTGVLDLADLDSAITKVEKRELGGRKVFLVSFERADEINQLLQPQQRFQGSVEVAAGFRVMTYRGIPIVRSKRVATNGVINDGGANNSTDADNAMYLLSIDDIRFKTVAGVDQSHIPINGGGDTTNYLQRGDVRGGYFKTYGCMVMRRFDNQAIIWNLTAP